MRRTLVFLISLALAVFLPASPSVANPPPKPEPTAACTDPANQGCMDGDDGIPSKTACKDRPNLKGCETYKKSKVPPRTGVDNRLFAFPSDTPKPEPEGMQGDDGISHGSSTIPLTTAAEIALKKRKQDLADFQPRAAAPSSSYLPRNHQAQQKNWWCGPATSVMALGHMGVKTTQLTMAKKYGNVTTVTGPGLATMQNVLNNMGGGRFA